MKFKATLIILAMLVTWAICLVSCSTRKVNKNSSKQEIEKVETLKVVDRQNELEEKTTLSVSFKTDSGTRTASIKPKGIFTFEDGKFIGDAESIVISDSYRGTSQTKDSTKQSIAKEKKLIREAKNTEKTKQAETTKNIEAKRPSKLLYILILIVLAGLCVWGIFKVGIN